MRQTPDDLPADDFALTGHPGTLAVVGAGAAGMSAAIFAARRGARVVLLETKARPGAKIRVSGGGRCNVLPSHAELDDFHTGGSTRAMRNVLFSWPLAEVRRFFEAELGVPLAVEPNGKVFPASNDAKDVVDALLRECERAGVELRPSWRVAAARQLESGGFELESDASDTLRAGRVVLATGGLSLPKTGSDGGGFAIARALGHAIEPTYPALVPLLTEAPGWRELTGISMPARVRAVRDGRVLEERAGDLLFTHRGFSGPVVLDMSRHATQPESAGVRLLVHWGVGPPGDWESALRASGTMSVAAVLRERLPRRLAELLVTLADVRGETRLCNLQRDARERLVGVLESCPLPVTGDEGYRTAEVTAGGVPLRELHLKTLESRLVPGLHFCGEVLDVVGRIGGYNFLWAWVSGRRAGEGAAGGAAVTAPSSLRRR